MAAAAALDTGHEKGGTQGSGSIGGPGNPIEGGGSQGGGKPPITMEPEPKAAPNPALEGFARQFAFAFRIPETLPGRFEFVEGRPVNPKAVELIYRKGTARLSVFLSPAEGPDVPVRGATLGGQELRCIRRHGLCAGFRGSINNADITESMSALVRKENEE